MAARPVYCTFAFPSAVFSVTVARRAVFSVVRSLWSGAYQWPNGPPCLYVRTEKENDCPNGLGRLRQC
jgi:hypothetical protein